MGSLKNKFEAFTLVEMLVVIAIIAILAAMLMPSMRNAIKTTKILTCANKLRNLSMKLAVYADDHRGYYPTHNYGMDSWPYTFNDWTGRNDAKLSNFYADYGPHTSEMYFCTIGVERGVLSDYYKYFPGRPPGKSNVDTSYTYFGGAEYKYASGVPVDLRYRKRNLRGNGPVRNNVKSGGRYCLVADVMRFGLNSSFDFPAKTWNHIDGDNHLSNAGGNMAYVDGHVKWQTGYEKLAKMRHAMKGNWNKAYATERPGDL